mmetsp:Transcript_70132/g.181867  ORF Transcript_70132/g.181867 Transcript_70132/m.181867 type:complete len:374 (-) Transcript_70132:7-1128(-)
MTLNVQRGRVTPGCQPRCSRADCNACIEEGCQFLQGGLGGSVAEVEQHRRVHAAVDAAALDVGALLGPPLAEVLDLPAEHLVPAVEHEDRRQLGEGALGVDRRGGDLVVDQATSSLASNPGDQVCWKVVQAVLLGRRMPQPSSIAVARQIGPRRHEQGGAGERQVVPPQRGQHRGREAAPRRLAAQEDLGLRIGFPEVLIGRKPVLDRGRDVVLRRPAVLRNTECRAEGACNRRCTAPQRSGRAEYVGPPVHVEHDAADALRRSSGRTLSDIDLHRQHPLKRQRPIGRRDRLLLHLHARLKQKRRDLGVACKAKRPDIPRHHARGVAQGAREDRVQRVVRTRPPDAAARAPPHASCSPCLHGGESRALEARPA